MITFRFYLVTLVAIFLAIALGVVIGSTFIEPALVDNLRNQVESVRGDLDQRVAAIDDLNTQIDGLEAYTEQSAPFAVDGKLVGTSVLVVAEEGVSGDDSEHLVGRIRQAGGSVDGIVWLQPKVSLDDPKDAERLREIVGLPADAPVTWDDAWALVLDDVAAVTGTAAGTGSSTTTSTTSVAGTGGDGSPPDGVASTTTTTAATVPAPGRLLGVDTLAALEEAGFVRVQRIEESGGTAERAARSEDLPLAVVLVTGPESDLDGGAVVRDLARTQAARHVDTALAEIWRETTDGPARGTSLAPVREDGELSSSVATVDDLDLVQGQVAVVAAVADLGRGIAGHYGYGDGAGRVLPEWLGP